MRIKKEHIQIISQYSNMSEEDVAQLLQQYFYNDQAAWIKFLKLFFLSLGVGFTTIGVIFFFAYNWADLHKFVKLGLVEGLIIGTTFAAIFIKANRLVKNILLTATSILVGVLFAVFGQIYQTGANAYDFFLGWTMFIAIWTIISNFATLWLVFIVLINVTLSLYFEQHLTHDWSPLLILSLFLAINTSFLLVSLIGSKISEYIQPPIWFTNLLGLAVASLATISISYGIFEEKELGLLTGVVLTTAVLYTLGIRYGLVHQRAFYLAIIPFSVLMIICAWLIYIVDSEYILLWISLLIIAGVTLMIKNIVNLQEQWKK